MRAEAFFLVLKIQFDDKLLFTHDLQEAVILLLCRGTNGLAIGAFGLILEPLPRPILKGLQCAGKGPSAAAKKLSGQMFFIKAIAALNTIFAIKAPQLQHWREGINRLLGPVALQRNFFACA